MSLTKVYYPMTNPLGYSTEGNNYGIIGAFPRTCSVMLIGDSITEGTGASSYTNSYAWLFGRSMMNSSNEGLYEDTGIGYHRVLPFSQYLQTPGITTTGSYVAAGIWQSQLSLTVGQKITLTKRELYSLGIVYDATASAGATFTFSLNGRVMSTITAAGSGPVFENRVLTTYGISTKFTDTIEITCTAGTLQVISIHDYKYSVVNDMIMYVGGKSGYAYQDYNTTTAMDELAYHMNLQRSANDKVLICNLGTNNMYNASKAVSPASLIANINTLVTGMRSRCSNLQVAIAVPPKSNESLFPMILPYTWEEYAEAIINYAFSNGITLIRHDKSALNGGAYTTDGLHPNDIGHKIFCETTCEALRVKYDAYWKNQDFSEAQSIPMTRSDALVTMNGTWGTYSGVLGFTPQVSKVNGNLLLSGVAIPNGSVSTTIGNLPAGFRPSAQDRYVHVATNVSTGTPGSAVLKIAITGDLVLNAVPTTDVSLDGVCIPEFKFLW